MMKAEWIMRNLFAGAASMRFQRRDANMYTEELRNYYGQGLGDAAKAVFKSTRMLLKEVKPTLYQLLSKC